MPGRLTPRELAAVRHGVSLTYIDELHELLGLSYEEIANEKLDDLWARYCRAENKEAG
jgi:hypothetical protein